MLDEPTNGTIYLDGKNIFSLPKDEKDYLKQRKISIIFQNNNLLNDFSALENVLMPLIIRGEKPYNSREKAKKNFEKFQFIRANRSFSKTTFRRRTAESCNSKVFSSPNRFNFSG